MIAEPVKITVIIGEGEEAETVEMRQFGFWCDGRFEAYQFGPVTRPHGAGELVVIQIGGREIRQMRLAVDVAEGATQIVVSTDAEDRPQG